MWGSRGAGLHAGTTLSGRRPCLSCGQSASKDVPFRWPPANWVFPRGEMKKHQFFGSARGSSNPSLWTNSLNSFREKKHRPHGADNSKMLTFVLQAQVLPNHFQHLAGWHHWNCGACQAPVIKNMQGNHASIKVRLFSSVHPSMVLMQRNNPHIS